MAKISANDIRCGNILVYKGELWIISKNPVHTKPGKGGAYVQVEMKNLKSGTKMNERFSSSEYVEKANFESKYLQFSYFDGQDMILLDTKTYEQFSINKMMLEDKLPFLEDNMLLEVEFYEDNPVNIILPPKVIVEIQETEPVIKGATATSSYKPAILVNGVRVMVPSYLNTGDKIVVKTEDLTFVERVK